MIGNRIPQQYGVDISSRRQLNELQRLEQSHGRTVYEWLDEGMPREAMGTPREMRAFRKRKHTPVPWDVDEQNDQSVQRNATVATDTGPAGETSVSDAVREVISSSGHSLDGAVQQLMEAEMGGSFDHVQIHTGPKAANACESINARAFTVGNHVAFNHGEYDPTSPEGQHVIAHELAHVRQQTGGAISMLPQGRVDVEADPGSKKEPQAESTANRVIQRTQLGTQRLEGTAIQRATKLELGTSQIPEPYRSLVDSREEVDSRKRRLQGTDTDGTSIQPAIQQRGPSCLLAMLQAYLVAEGRDTTSFAQIIQNYPRDIETEGSLNSSEVTIVDFIRHARLGFTRDTQDYLLELLADIEQTDGPPAHSKWARHFQSKGITCALGNVYQDKKKRGEITTKQQEQNDETLITGTNLLKRTRKRIQGLFPIQKLLTERFSDNMERLKGTFIKAIVKVKTPVLVSATGFYNPQLPEDNPFEDERPGHVRLVYGVWVDENGNTFVAYRDGHDQNGVTYDLELNKFLSPLHKTSVEALKDRNTYCRDVDMNSATFLIAPLSMDFENKNEPISKQVDSGDETDVDYHSATEDETESLP